jgi:hypothetical protein
LNQNLPTFVVLVAEPSNKEQLQAISARLWSSGFLSGEHAGVSFRSQGDPILFINNPAGVPADLRRKQLDGLKTLNEISYQKVGDPETHTRIQQFEMAFHMQASVPELMNVTNEPELTYRLYGEEARKPGTFAYACLLARRPSNGTRAFKFTTTIRFSRERPALHIQCRTWIRQRALINDLKARGMLDSTLIIWGGNSC